MLSPRSTTREATTVRSPALKSSPCSLQLEKAGAQRQRPSTEKKNERKRGEVGREKITYTHMRKNMNNGEIWVKEFLALFPQLACKLKILSKQKGAPPNTLTSPKVSRGKI